MTERINGPNGQGRVLRAPFNWEPRWYQQEAWDYLKNGGKHAELIWHRRAGKDDVCLNHAACEMMVRPGNYWHMLPKANQVRKAIWEAVNPRTGRRRVMEAFPPEIFEHRNTDMFIQSKVNGATWQAFGSDNYEAAVGSGPRGIVYSEWAQANPSSRGYFRPMIAENSGYQIFISTPRGKNHAYSTFQAAHANQKAFAQLLTIHDTQALSAEQLVEELQEYVSTYGESMGLALFEQEYECNFDAAILGAIWGDAFRTIDKDGRITNCPYTPGHPVYVTMDIGRTDDTALWFFQVINNRPHIIDCYYNSGKDPDHFASVMLGYDVGIDLIDGEIKVRREGVGPNGTEYGMDNAFAHRQEWEYGAIYLPHDGAAKTFAAHGKSVEEQLGKVFGAGKVRITPNLSKEDGIIAARQMLKVAVFDLRCEPGIDACRFYHREWDDDRKMFKKEPEHDWSSHFADALRYMGVIWTSDKPKPEEQPARWKHERTIDEMIRDIGRKRKSATW